MTDGPADLKEVQGLRLLRAFLRLPSEERAKVIAVAETLADRQTPPRSGTETQAK